MNSAKKQIILLILGFIILGLFLYFYNYFNIKNNYDTPIFNSPDETSNYFFIKNFANNNVIAKNLNYQINEIKDISELIHPRSMTINNLQFIPISFIGIILIYGTIAKIFGIWIIQYLTPIFSILGIIFLYLLIKKEFNQKIAMISSLLIMLNPGFWYFSSKLLMHNMLFISLLIISYYFLILSIKNKKIIHYALWGFFLALALITRSSEFIWIFFSIILIAIFYKYKINYKIIVAIIVFLITIFPIFYFNRIHSSSYLKFSYTQNLDTSIVANSISNPDNINVLRKSFDIIFPFGINIRNVIYVFYNFFLKLNWLFFLLLSITLVLIFIKRKNITKKELALIILWFFISSYLFIYYGSWIISDDAIKNSITIGGSYIRYLLPFFILSSILIAVAICKFHKTKLMTAIVAVLIGIFANVSYSMVYDIGVDSQKNISKNINYFYNLKNLIIKETEENAIILTNRSDKFIFPHRNVVYLNDSDIYNYEHIQRFKDVKIPLYYFDNKKELSLPVENIKLESIFNNKEYFLYKIIFINDD